MPKTKFIALIGFLVFALSFMGVWAQSSSSTITGAIKDASGAVIPGVEVMITNLGTGNIRTVLTSDTGGYRVGNLPPASYEVKASLTGFKTALAQVTTSVDEVSNVSLVLEIGDVAEVVTVMDAATTVNVEEGRVSTLVDSKRIVDMPLNGRNVYQLMQVAPGVVNTEATVDEPGALANVNGGRANMNGFWMDGITTTGLSGGTGAGDGPGFQPNLDAIQEFRIETLNFSAEYGGNTASVVSVVSKSGTNDLHGSLFWFHRNDNLDAREFFDSSKPNFLQHQFGASAGGPVWKDKTFFFASYEGTRIRTGESERKTYESAAWGSYASTYGAPVGAFLFGNYPAPPLESVTSTVGDYLVDGYWIEDPGQAAVDAFLGETFGSPPGALSATAPMIGQANFFTPDNSDHNGLNVRIDHNFSDSDRFFARYFYIKNDGTQVADPRPAFTCPFFARNHLLALNWAHILSPSTINELRAGLTKYDSDILAGTPGVPWIAEGSGGVATWGAYNGYPQIFHENRYTFADTLSLNIGSHALKVGGEVRRNQENSEFNVGRPSTYFYDLVYIALDEPYYLAGGVDPHFEDGPGNAELASSWRGWRGSEMGFFFNDDWKVLPNLTLNLGVRWDWFSRLSEVQGRATAYDMTRTTLGNDFYQRVAAGDFIGVDQLSEDDWNNFAPRFGFAWDPCGDGKMSVRGGFGIAYNGAVYNPLANSRWNKPYYSFNGIGPNWGQGDTILYGPQDGSPVRVDGPNNNPGARLFEGNIIAYEPNQPNFAFLTGIPNPRMRDPYTQSFFVGIQRELMRDTTLEVNYVGTLGRKLIRAENFNRFAGDRLGLCNPATGAGCDDTDLNRMNPNEGTLRFWENSVNSSYHSLQAQFNKRYSANLALNMSYTWAKALDVRSTWHSGNTSSNFAQEGYSTDLRYVSADYGRAVFDAPHRFVTNWLWDTPWMKDADSWFARNIVGGWQINGIVALQAGQPFTPYSALSFSRGGDWNGDGNNNDRPNTPSGGSRLSCERGDWTGENAGCFNIPGSTYEDRLAFFGTPELGSIGTLGRNTYSGPGFANVDLALFKSLSVPQISEEAHFQLRFEFYNLFNRVNFWQPEVRLNYDLFGQPTQAFDAREIQIGLKFVF